MAPLRPPNDPNRVGGNDPIARILKLAGSRPQPDPERKADFKAVLHAEWRRVTDARPERHTVRWVAAAAMAAGIVAAVVVARLDLRTTPQPGGMPMVGRVLRSEGVVRTMAATAGSGSWRVVAAGDELRGESVLETGNAGRIALGLGDRASLRIDVDSRIVLVGPRVVRVERGAAYVDVNGEKTGSVRVFVHNSEIRDIGTRFEVRVQDASFRVRVREGEVLLNRRGSEATARAGEALHVDREGRYARSLVPTFGPEWAWTSAIAPQFQLEGSTVRQFLDWVAREQGWRWRFVDADTERQAAEIVTHGSVEGYTPEEALSIVLPTCGLAFVRDRDEVIVSLMQEPSPSGR